MTSAGILCGDGGGLVRIDRPPRCWSVVYVVSGDIRRIIVKGASVLLLKIRTTQQPVSKYLVSEKETGVGESKFTHHGLGME